MGGDGVSWSGRLNAFSRVGRVKVLPLLVDVGLQGEEADLTADEDPLHFGVA